MKKSLCLLAVVLFSLQSLSAQFAIGLKGGWNYNNTTAKDFSSNLSEEDYVKNRSGYHIGAYATIELGNLFALQPEIAYISKASSTTLFEDISNDTFKDLSLNYISIPVLLLIRPIKMIAFEIGPDFNILTDAKVSDTDADIAKSAFKNADIGLDLGIQVFLGERLRLGARYNRGLTNVSEFNFTDDAGQAIDGDWKNSSIQLWVGVNLFSL